MLSGLKNFNFSRGFDNTMSLALNMIFHDVVQPVFPPHLANIFPFRISLTHVYPPDRQSIYLTPTLHRTNEGHRFDARVYRLFENYVPPCRPGILIKYFNNKQLHFRKRYPSFYKKNFGLSKSFILKWEFMNFGDYWTIKNM